MARREKVFNNEWELKLRKSRTGRIRNKKFTETMLHKRRARPDVTLVAELKERVELPEYSIRVSICLSGGKKMVLRLNEKWRKIIESLSLFAAIVFLIPVIPSNLDPIDLLPAGAFSIVFFALSRYLRKVTLLHFVLEIMMFGILVFLNNEAANILLNTNA